MRILTVPASLNAASKNLRLIESLENSWRDEHECIRTPLLSELPFFNPDLDDSDPPREVIAFRDQVRAADLIVIASPEYGHSLPGVLKNAIDWLIPTGELYAKPVMVTCAVNHPERGRLGLGALAQCLHAVDVDLIHCEPTVNEDVGPLQAALLRVKSRGPVTGAAESGMS